jgi:putative endonuclease
MKTTNHARGILAEYVALAWLIIKGYHFVTMRYKTAVGEVDLIMRRKKTLVFVEVKARADAADAAAAIHAKNRARVVRAAQHFLTCHPDYLNYEVRFDAVLITWYGWPQHLANAFGETI